MIDKVYGQEWSVPYSVLFHFRGSYIGYIVNYDDLRIDDYYLACY